MKVGEDAAHAVGDDRVVLPGVPVAEHDAHELVGAVVARVVHHVDLAAHVVRLSIIHRCPHVPRRAAAQHVIDGLEPAGDVEWFVIGGGGGGADAEAGGAEAHGHHGGDWVDLHHPHAIGDHFRRISAIDVRHGQAIVEECQLELALFEHLADALVIGRAGEVRSRVRMAPGAGQGRAVLGLQKAHHDHLSHRSAPVALRPVCPGLSDPSPSS